MKKDFLINLKNRLLIAAKDNNQKEIKEIEEFLENPKFTSDTFYHKNNTTGLASIDIPHKKYFKKGVLETEYPKMKMYDYLYLKREKHLNFKALNYYGKEITFQELFSKIEETAKSFKFMGVKEGDYVVISMPTTPESVYMLFALNRIGAIPVELDPRTTEEDTKKTILESKTKFVVTMEECSNMIDNILRKSKEIDNQIQNVMFVSPTISLPFGLNIASDLKDKVERLRANKPILPTNKKYLNWHSFIKKGRNYYGPIDSKYEYGSVAEVIYSSGTTSSPKPIEYTNETFTAMVRQLELGENAYKERDKNLDIIPMFLGFGSNNGLYVILCFGVEDILIPVPVIEKLPKLINKYKPNHLLGAPIHMKVLLNYLKDNPSSMTDLSYIKSIVCGSAYLESSKQYELDDELSKRGCTIKVGPGYGQNEGGPTLSFSPDSFLEIKKPGCSGFPLAGTTISIFNPETDVELEYGKDLEGEIRYKTPCSMKGYAFDRKELTKKYYRNGWCCSGDLGKIDSDGGIYITGRIERQIHRNGFKFSPTEIEDYITMNIPSIESCALIGRPDDKEESIPILYYSIKNGEEHLSDVIREQIIRICSTLKQYKIPVEYVEMDSLPLTKNLKVDFKELEKNASNINKNRLTKKLVHS